MSQPPKTPNKKPAILAGLVFWNHPKTSSIVTRFMSELTRDRR